MPLPLRFECIKDITSAKTWWCLFSPDYTLWDSWEMRHHFYQYMQSELFFYVGFVGDEPVGLLPLQYNDREKHLEFFGGGVTEDNLVFVKFGFEHTIPEFYKQITLPATLEYIIGTDEFTTTLPILDYKFILHMDKYTGYDDYINTAFSSKSRSQLKKKIADIEAGNIRIEEQHVEDIDLLIDMNIKTFEARGEISSFLFPHRKTAYREMSTFSIPMHLLTFYHDNQKVAVSMSLAYKKGYFFLNAGTDTDRVPNIGTYVYLKNIERAFSLRCEFFDAFAGSFNWKERLHLSPHPVYLFLHPTPPATTVSSDTVSPPQR